MYVNNRKTKGEECPENSLFRTIVTHSSQRVSETKPYLISKRLVVKK